MSRTVVIVGSGVAGALVAKKLLENARNLERVIVLEAGGVVPQMDRRKWMDYVTTWRLPYDPNKDTRDEYEVSAGKISFEGGRLFARGGSTMHWGGWSFRFKPEDFRLRTQTGRELDWPFGYEQLEPYYWEAERLLGISGDSTSDDPPRMNREYPYPPTAMVAGDEPVRRSLEAMGISYGHFPIARYADRCVTTGTCRYCPVGGRYSATQTLDQLEREHGRQRFSVVVGAAVRRVLVDGPYRVRGVEYLDTTGGTIERLECDVVVLCAGAIETPKLLLASTSPTMPAGIGNHAGHVGRHFKIHPMLYVDAMLPGNPQRILQELDFPTLASRHYDTEGEQREGKLLFTRTSRFPQVDIEGMMRTGASRSEIERATTGATTVTLSGFIEEFSTIGSRVSLANGTTRFGLPRTTVHYAPRDNRTAVHRHLDTLSRILVRAGAKVAKRDVYDLRIDHCASTARMSAEPGNGVIDANLRVHDIENLYVCSAAAFPNIAAVPPTLTLAALALRLGDFLSRN